MTSSDLTQYADKTSELPSIAVILKHLDDCFTTGTFLKIHFSDSILARNSGIIVEKLIYFFYLDSTFEGLKIEAELMLLAQSTLTVKMSEQIIEEVLQVLQFKSRSSLWSILERRVTDFCHLKYLKECNSKACQEIEYGACKREALSLLKKLYSLFAVRSEDHVQFIMPSLLLSLKNMHLTLKDFKLYEELVDLVRVMLQDHPCLVLDLNALIREVSSFSFLSEIFTAEVAMSK